MGDVYFHDFLNSFSSTIAVSGFLFDFVNHFKRIEEIQLNASIHWTRFGL